MQPAAAPQTTLCLAALILGMLVALTACSTAPPLSAPTADARLALVRGGAFSHRTIFKPGSGSRLHVYIEGDGRPWVTPRSIARDPTPRSPLLNQLMAADPAPALYLGRPCYFDTGDAACDDAKWWTSHRYAAEVVDSLHQALAGYAHRYDSLVLIGHSGGGTLAYLMSTQRDDVAALVTLAGNLNVSLWTQQHGYTPLTGSLDPAQRPALKDSIKQRHYRGTQDERISPAMITSVTGHQPNARYIEIEGADHSCCWASHWPQILQDLAVGR